jgi:tripartite-type tricarboxylate transporter receptor subunit TctC
VPYKGSSQARQDVLSGQVQVAVDGLGPALPLIKGGRLIAIGLMSSVRAQSNPEIPTIGEIIPGYASETWYGILAPAGTPRDVVARLNAAAVKVIASRSVSEQFQKLGAEAVGNTPEQFRRMLESEQKVWSKVVRDSGAKAE